MGRSNRIVLALEFLAFIALFGGASVAQGGLYLDTHEGDTYHLLDILLRMEMGQTPHLDFMTPIGFLAFLPIVLLLKVEFSIGMSILWAQIAVAILGSNLDCIMCHVMSSFFLQNHLDYFYMKRNTGPPSQLTLLKSFWGSFYTVSIMVHMQAVPLVS